MSMSTFEFSSVHDSDAFSPLPSYCSQTRAPSYITNIDSENHGNIGNIVRSVASDHIDADDQPTPRHSPRPPTYITDLLHVDDLDLSEETNSLITELAHDPLNTGDQPDAQVDGVLRVEGGQPQVLSAESSPLYPERLEPLRYSVAVHPNDPTVTSPNVRHSGITNVLSRGLQRALAARSERTQPPSAGARNRSATLPSAAGVAQRNLAPIQFPSVHILRYTLMKPLVTMSSLKDHLSLLSIFRMLKKDVENMDELRYQSGLSCLIDEESRWTWFVGFAVERFSAWSEALKTEDLNGTLEEFVPPVDVLMVWHTYLLNPGWYAEDCYRIPALNVLGRIGQLIFAPNSLLTVVTILCEPITERRREMWSLKTQGRPFDAFEDAKRNQLKLIWCPDSYMNAEGTGYLQQNFMAACSSDPCYFNTHKIVKTALGARKFAEDLVRPDDNTHRSHIAGTFWAAAGLDDGTRAKKLKKRIFEGFKRPRGLADERLVPMLFKRYRDDPLRQNRSTGRVDMVNEGWALSILYGHGFALPRIIHALARWLRTSGYDPEAMSRRIYSAYTTGDLFSVDLRGSVLRQCSFIEQVDKIGWLAPGFFDHRENQVLLHHAIIRYHGFIELMSFNVTSLLVPTLDIDLAWHTHQLSGRKYHSLCMKCIGRFIDHNDKIEENRLTGAFEETCKAWRTKFEVGYTSCGCPSAKAVNDHLNGSLGIPAPIIASTHPSDHDAVYNNRQPVKSNKLRVARLEKRDKKLKNDRKSLSFPRGGHPSDWTFEDYDCPFTHPLPAWYSSSDKAGYASYAAHMVDSQPLGEIKDVPQEMKKYSDSTCVALLILEY